MARSSATPPAPRRPNNRQARRAGERDARLQQLAEMGRIAAGLAHELKNPLSTLKLNLQLLQEDLAELPGAEASRARAANLWKVADRLSTILDDFLRYAGRIELRLAPTPLNTLIEDLMDFIHPQAQASHVRAHLALSAENPLCQVDANLLKQALLNLLINAIQAMPDGGDLIVRTHHARDRAMIDIADTGVGIPKENIERIFDAYFTTKKGGTGLGLPTTRRIIEEHRGSITVSSEPNRGTNFRIELPLCQPGAAPGEASAEPS